MRTASRRSGRRRPVPREASPEGGPGRHHAVPLALLRRRRRAGALQRHRRHPGERSDARGPPGAHRPHGPGHASGGRCRRHCGHPRGDLRHEGRVLRGKTISLLSRTSAQQGWRHGKSLRTGSDGAVGFRVRPQTRTAYRLAFAGTPGSSRPGAGPSVRRAAGRDRRRRAGPGQPGSELGRLRHVMPAGSPVAGAPSTCSAARSGRGRLGGRWSGHHAADGSVSFPSRRRRDTRYRLRVTPRPGCPPASRWSRSTCARRAP